jgi:hypothetical protein
MGLAALSLAKPDATREVCNHILLIVERAES